MKIAPGSPDDAAQQDENTGDPQNMVNNTYPPNVNKGGVLHLSYEPTVQKNDEWFGCITSF